MEKIRARRTSSDYIGAIDTVKNSSIDITSTTKQLIRDKHVTNVNLNELFLTERSNCRNYRIILTLNPYCTNVLYNSCTEITYENDNSELCSVTEETPATCEEAIGKKYSLTPIDMIRNTEYSSEKYNFTYLPGLDIFNNHIIRNKSYRIVNKLEDGATNNNFNTIRDDFRLDDGTILKKCCRIDIDDTTLSNKHLYDDDDILSFETGDAIKENLREENGWFGFYNTSTIDAKDSDNESLDISRVINNKGNCQFVDLYPGRDLFSFTPQYNTRLNRVENNWDIILTYPYENTTTRDYIDEDGDIQTEDIHVIQSNGQNGLYVVDAKMIKSPSGDKAVMFRTLTKHNLTKNDTVHMYYNENSDGNTEVVWNFIDNDFIVYSTGDEDGNNDEYYFTIKNDDLLNEIFCTPKEGESYTSWDYIRDYFYEIFTINDVPIFKEKYTYNIGEPASINGQVYICVQSKSDLETYVINPNNPDYNVDKYFTLLDDYCLKYDATVGLTNFPTNRDSFIKVGNDYYCLKNHDTGYSFITKSHTMTAEDFIMGIVNNAFRIEDEEYQDSMDGSVWNDYITFRMVKVIDGVESEYYVRKFKKLADYDNELYKLAFADTIYGDDIAQITYTDTISTKNITDNLGRELTEIYATIVKNNKGYKEWYIDKDYNNSDIECSHCFGPVTCGFDFYNTSSDTISIKKKRKGDYDVKFLTNDLINNKLYNLNLNEITSDDDWFYGDIVEYNTANCIETILCDVNFRFNTAQRELGHSNPYKFIYDDIVSDDYSGDFKCSTTTINGLVKNEGYYYKPHYKIKIRNIGDLQQDYNRTLFIKSAKPYQSNGMFININTTVTHRLVQGDKVILVDNIHNTSWTLDVVSILNKYSFVMNKIDRSNSNYYDWVTICTCLNNGDFKLKALNSDIPSYAIKTGTGTYLWRETLGLWEGDDAIDIPYANNALYIDNIINLYLKRQNNDNSITEYIIPDYGEVKTAIDDEAEEITDITEELAEAIKDNDGTKNEEPSNYDYKEESENKC